MFEEFKAFIKPFSEKLENLLKFGKVLKVNGSNGQLQNVQIKTLRNIEDAYKLGQFGFNSKSPVGSRVVVAEISNEKIVITNEHLPSIIDVSSGNTIIYNESGKYIKLVDGVITHFGTSHIINGDTQTVNADETINGNEIINGNETINGNLSVNGSGAGGSSQINNTTMTFDDDSDIIIGGISLKDFISNHTHTSNGTGNETSTPNL
jgi:phage gp45-like